MLGERREELLNVMFNATSGRTAQTFLFFFAGILPGYLADW